MELNDQNERKQIWNSTTAKNVRERAQPDWTTVRRKLSVFRGETLKHQRNGTNLEYAQTPTNSGRKDLTRATAHRY